MTRHKVIKTKITKTLPYGKGQPLPEDTANILKSLSYSERISYCRALSNKGWTLQSIATPLGISRERVRQMISNYSTPDSVLPVPEIPDIVLTQEISEMKVLPEDLLKLLKDLQAKAFWVRGNGKQNRAEAEEYVCLLNNLTQQGYTIYGLASQIGVNPVAIHSRLVRYGYKQTLGKSDCFRKVIYSNRHKP